MIDSIWCRQFGQVSPVQQIDSISGGE